MKMEWEKPILEVLDVKQTMAGPGHHYTDSRQNDPDDFDKYS
jgi:hypothetical protein